MRNVDYSEHSKNLPDSKNLLNHCQDKVKTWEIRLFWLPGRYCFVADQPKQALLENRANPAWEWKASAWNWCCFPNQLAGNTVGKLRTQIYSHLRDASFWLYVYSKSFMPQRIKKDQCAKSRKLQLWDLYVRSICSIKTHVIHQDRLQHPASKKRCILKCSSLPFRLDIFKYIIFILVEA